MALRVGILTVSDACSRGDRHDASGDAIVEWVESRGGVVACRACVPDESGPIIAALTEWADADRADVVLTTGGTGLSARDVTPEATRAAVTREAQGIAEALRAASVPAFPRAALSRGVAGVRARTLIINLPGSVGGVRDGVAALASIIDHASAIVRGHPTEHS